jgi:hypothetical protein
LEKRGGDLYGIYVQVNASIKMKWDRNRIRAATERPLNGSAIMTFEFLGE